MPETLVTTKYPFVKKLKAALSSLSNYYFVPIALLAVVAFFSPPVAGLGIVILLTGSVWVFVDSCGGISHSVDFLLNTRYHHEDGKDYLGKKLHVFNLLWCLSMLGVAIVTFTASIGVLWASLASIAFGCAMWIYVIDDLHAKRWDLKALRNPRSIARILGGLGALLFAFYASGLGTYAVGVLGMVCYILAVIVKIIDIFYSDSQWPSDAISTDASPSNGQEFTPVNTYDAEAHPDIEVAPQDGLAHDIAIPEKTDFHQLGQLPEFRGAFEQILDASIPYQDSSAPIIKKGDALVCSVEEGGGRDQHVVAMMARAVTEYQLGPIYIAGGSEQAQIVAIRAALRFGFTDIEVRAPDSGVKPHPDYHEVVSLVHAIREKYGGHKELLATVKTSSEGEISQHILHSQYRSLPPENQRVLEKLYPEALRDMPAKYSPLKRS